MTSLKSGFDWATIFLLALMQFSASTTVNMSEWAPGLDLLPVTALAALLLGSLVTRSKFYRFPAHLLGLGYGAAWIVLTSLRYLPQTDGLESLGVQLIMFGQHISEWVWLMLNSGVGRDNFIFLVALMIIFWQLGYLAAWYTFRVPRALRAVLPAGLVILIDLYYYGGSQQLTVFLYIYFVAALMYIVRVHYRTRQQEWQRARVGFDSDLRGLFLRGGSVVTAAAVLIAWVVPAVAPMPQFDELWRQVSKPIRAIEDGFSRVFSALQGEGPVLTNPYGRTLGFSGPRDLGETVVMDVFVHESSDNAHELARYWRAVAYDVYTGSGWQSTDADSYSFGPNVSPLESPYQRRSNIRQTYTFYRPRTSLLHSAAQVVYFNREAEADASVSGGQLINSQLYVDPSRVISRDVLLPGDSYDAVSALSTADSDVLRNSSTNYPAAIAERYLQLPRDFSPRVQALAEEIVADASATNSFDQATALERWLRLNIVYNEKIEGPAPGQDGVEYVLFDAHAGYCDYYASAMATMARSLGIPARVVVGFARGEFNDENRNYRVRERDAHTWVEVFFPEYGWVEFEPTAAQPLISRPVTVTADEPPPAPQPTLDPSGRDDPFLRDNELLDDEGLNVAGDATLLGVPLVSLLLTLSILFIVGGALTLVAMYVYENRGLRKISGAGWAYARLMRLASWLDVEVRPDQTPYEQATRMRDATPENRHAIDSITRDFVRETFARDDSGARRARLLWQRVRFRLWRGGVLRRVQKLIRRGRPVKK